MPKLIDVTGQRFGRLTAIRRVENRGTNIYWLFRCDCGTEREIFIANAKRGFSQSCGCLQQERRPTIRRTHGASGSPAFWSWSSAKGRCTNPNNSAWKDYGGRGITMDARWLESFATFLADMGDRPAGHSLDRIDNSGPYSPANCRWASRTQQARNKRNTVFVTCEGEQVSLIEFAHRKGVGYKGLHDRISTKGETPHEAADAMLERRRRYG